MGMPSDMDYPTKNIAAQSVQYVQQTAIDTGHSVVANTNRVKDFVIGIGDQIGWTTLACLILSGAAVWVVIIFKREIKKRFGEIIAVLNDKINK